MDGAAKRWIQEYKKIFDLVAKYNAGMNVVTNQVGVQSAEGRGQSAATQVPKSVIKRIGKVVPEGNGEESAEGRVQSAETTPSTAGGPFPSRVRLSAENKIVRLGKLADSDKKTATGTENVRDSGERFALPDGLTNVDPTSVTEEEVKILLERSAKKQYKDSTYVPVRVNTPQILIEVAQSYGEKIDNLPVVMQVEKVRQAMSTQEQWQSEGKRSRAHELSSGDIISIIKAINTPKYIVYQTNNDRYVEIVKYKSSNNTEAVAIIEIGEHKNPQYLNGYKGGEYQVLITTFNPDENTIESILNNNSNRVLYPKKKKGSSQRGSGNNVPSHLNDSPFAISISQNAENSNTFNEKSAKDHKQSQFDIIQETNPMGDDYHVGIRSVDDIRTWDEVLKLDDESEGQFFWGDFSRADAEQALKDGKITVYSSYPIRNGVFVSTSYVQAEEYAGGRGKKVYSKTVPLTDVAWINGDEGQFAAVDSSTKTVDSGERFALADGSRATTTEVAAAKRNIREMGVDPAGIVSIADKYFDRYSGQLTRTGVRYEFLSAAETLFDKSAGAMDRAYAKIEALADELISNEKDTSGRTEEINSIKRHIREITFEVRDRDKGEFDSVGGYAQYRRTTKDTNIACPCFFYLFFKIR